MTEWNIQARAHACEACGKAFVDQESYHTLLFDEKSVERTPPSARISPELCTKAMRGARVSVVASRTTAFPVNVAVCADRTNAARSP